MGEVDPFTGMSKATENIGGGMNWFKLPKLMPLVDKTKRQRPSSPRHRASVANPISRDMRLM